MPGRHTAIRSQWSQQLCMEYGSHCTKITISQPGRYWVRATTPCGTTTSDTLDIVQSGTSAFPAITTNDTICAGERANLYASGNAHWYDAPVGGNLVFIGNNYQTGAYLITPLSMWQTSPRF